MTISKKDQKLLLVFFGILILLAVYFWVYNSFIGRADQVRTEISNLEPRLEELRGYYNNLGIYQAGIDEISEQVELELAKFPSDVRSEDMVLYGSSLESALGMTVSSMAFSPVEVISQFSLPVSNGSGTELIPYAAFHTGLTVNGEMTYEHLKKLVNYIYSTPQRTSLESLSVSYNAETGKLAADAAIAKYFINGEEYVYEKTKVPSFKAGTGNPFGTAASGTGDNQGGEAKIED